MRASAFFCLLLVLGCHLDKIMPPAVVDTADAAAQALPDTDQPLLDTGDGPPDLVQADCAPISVSAGDWELCFEGRYHCEAVYRDSSGCEAVCAAVGLPCTGAFEDREGACAPDLDRDVLSCESGHQSDYCICGGSGRTFVDDPGSESPDLGRFESLYAERGGYAEAVTGGDPARIYTVTSLADEGPGTLRAALESDEPWSIVFGVDGLITWQDDVYVTSNKTVDGRGRDITVDGTWRIQRVHNVIISDVAVTRSIREDEEACEQDGDAILIRGDGGSDPADFNTHHIWLHHLDLQDGGDGLLDIRGGTYITVSWSRFAHHKKVSLAWQDAEGQSTEGMVVTWHHNHFDHTTVRNPRFHYGRAHFVNNFMDEWWQSGAASYDGAEFFSEANVYLAADDCYGIPGVMPCIDDNPCAINNDWYVDRSLAVISSGSSAPGKIKSSGDLLLNGAVIEVTRPSEVFDPSESYSLAVEPATESLAATIAAEAGPRRAWVE